MKSSKLSSGTLVALGVAAFALVAAAVVAAAPFIRPGDAGVASVASAATVGGPFRLVSSRGGALSDVDLKGKPFAIFFGFTHCPEVCPTSLWDMSEALKRLGPKGEDLKVLFVTVDPERDTPEILARYLQSFDPRIIGLSGARKDIDAVARAYRVYWRKIPTSDGDYTMDHTSLIYLMDAEGGYSGFIAYKDDAETRDRKLNALLDAKGPTG
ncbi:MAG: hypothetical protein B7Y95_04840 [Rhizobiales bacterium 32-66-11]|nr:MAG: hypothetical protein B7Y95_04840 [Rhizobiales bacterium 32-66-11]